MELKEFSFGVSFCKDVYRKDIYKRILAPLLYTYALEGNVFCIHVLEDTYLDYESGLFNYGKFTGNRLIKERLAGSYSERTHFNLLTRKGKKIFFFTQDSPSDLAGHNLVKTINLHDFPKYSEFFYRKEAIQIRQDNLAEALNNSVSGNGSEIEIREPYLKGEFLSALLKYQIFDKCKITYHFSIFDKTAWIPENAWMLDPDDGRWGSIKSEVYKKILVGNAQRHVDGLFDYHLKEARNGTEIKEARNKINIIKNKLRLAQANNSLRLLFYVLKEQHYKSPRYTWDRNGHWHHRFLKILDQQNLYTFESSHSFIHRKVQPHWHIPGEYLHFRHAKNDEFDSFKKAFDEPVEIKV